VDLKLELAERKRQAALLVVPNYFPKDVKLSTFNIDLEDINESMTWRIILV
jgi:hypothetical protein